MAAATAAADHIQIQMNGERYQQLFWFKCPMWRESTSTFTFVSFHSNCFIAYSVYFHERRECCMDRLSFPRTACGKGDYIRKWWRKTKKNVSLAHTLTLDCLRKNCVFFFSSSLYCLVPFAVRYHFSIHLFSFWKYFTYKFSPSMGIGTINSTLSRRLIT